MSYVKHKWNSFMELQRGFTNFPSGDLNEDSLWNMTKLWQVRLCCYFSEHWSYINNDWRFCILHTVHCLSSSHTQIRPNNWALLFHTFYIIISAMNTHILLYHIPAFVLCNFTLIFLYWFYIYIDRYILITWILIFILEWLQIL
jgi:hypothetical protein